MDSSFASEPRPQGPAFLILASPASNRIRSTALSNLPRCPMASLRYHIPHLASVAWQCGLNSFQTHLTGPTRFFLCSSQVEWLSSLIGLPEWRVQKRGHIITCGFWWKGNSFINDWYNYPRANPCNRSQVAGSSLGFGFSRNSHFSEHPSFHLTTLFSEQSMPISICVQAHSPVPTVVVLTSSALVLSLLSRNQLNVWLHQASLTEVLLV